MSQTSKIVSQMQICIDECMAQFSVITKELSFDSINKSFNSTDLLEILCSSRSSCVLRFRRFVVEVLWGFRGLNPWSFTDLWLFEVSRGFWAWFQWTLRSRQIIWMILLWMFFDFEFEVLEGFEAWFLQSFITFESWSPQIS